MTNPSAVEGSGVASTGRDNADRSTPEDQSSTEDLAAVDEGILLLARYDQMFGDLLTGLGRLPMPGR